MPTRLTSTDPSFSAQLDRFLRARQADQADVGAQVAAILADVRSRGDVSVRAYTERFDRMTPGSYALEITPDEMAAADQACGNETLAALDEAAERIRAFHAAQPVETMDYVDAAGIRLGARWTPLAAVGVYVPGGLAAYPSSVLMNLMPARVAGVERIVMTVPTPDGKVSPLVLAAARRAGVTEVYRIGGAQAIGALAYGTETILPVDKIVGPGNAYVAEAKRQVFGIVGIDMIAGPSEILVVADAGNDPAWIAVDLLSQAEHDRDAQAILITDNSGFAEAVALAVDRALETLPRADIAGASWRDFGAIIVVRDLLEDAPDIIDRIAPEHLELAVAKPEPVMQRVRHAGAIFLGRHTPEAIGDYVAGPNHVLPTYRSARFSSGLNVLDFMKRTTFVGCDAASLARIGPAAVTLAQAEGLDAHARSVALRLNGDRGSGPER